MRSTCLLLAAVMLCTSSANLNSTTSKPIACFGTRSNFGAEVVQSLTEVVSDLYGGCTELNSASEMTSSGSICVARLISYMLQAVAIVTKNSTATAVIGPGMSNITLAKATSPDDHSRRSTHHFLDVLNERAADLGPIEEGIRATNITSSTVHPIDGIAVQTSLRNRDAAMYVHTNGTHALARFDHGSQLGKRDVLDTRGHQYHFSAVNGIKLEALGLDTTGVRPLLADLNAFAYGFAYGDSGNSPAFMQGQSWKYAVCEKTTRKPIFYGRLIAELDRGPKYQHYQPQPKSIAPCP